MIDYIDDIKRKGAKISYIGEMYIEELKNFEKKAIGKNYSGF